MVYTTKIIKIRHSAPPNNLEDAFLVRFLYLALPKLMALNAGLFNNDMFIAHKEKRANAIRKKLAWRTR